MKVNRNSWHFKAFEFWRLESEGKRARAYTPSTRWDGYDEKGHAIYREVPARPVSLCPYFWIVVLRAPALWLFSTVEGLITFVVLAFIAGETIAISNGLAWWQIPLTIVGIVLLFGVIIALAVGAGVVKEWWENRQYGKPAPVEKEPNLFVSFVKAKKSKVCPILEFED